MLKNKQTQKKTLKGLSRLIGNHALIAIMIIAMFAGLGAYKVFDSSAASQRILKPNGCEPGQNKNDQGRCVQKNSRDAIKQECAEYNVKFDNSGGGSCRQECIDNYVNINGTCEKKKQCDGQNERRNPDTNNCVCEQGWDRDASGKCLKKEGDGSGGGGSGGGGAGGGGGSGSTGCAAGKTKLDNYCVTVSKVNACNKERKKFNAANDNCTNECKASFDKVDGYCITVASRNKCQDKHLNYNKQDDFCTDTCWSDYSKVSGVCVTTARYTACARANKNYNITSDSCTDVCKTGYEKKGNECKLKSSTSGQPSSGSGGSTGGSGSGGSAGTTGCPTGKVKSEGYCITTSKLNECNKQNKLFNKAQDICTNNCRPGFEKSGNECKQPQSNQCPSGKIRYDGYCVTQTELRKCQAAQATFNAAQDKCSNVCQSGYVMIGGSCQRKKTCDGNNIRYDAATNTCVCNQGMNLQEGYCISASKRDECITQKHQQYDRITNNCVDACIGGWKKVNGNLPCVQVTNGLGGGGCPEGKVRNLTTGNCQTPASCQASGAQCAPLPPVQTSDECNKLFLQYSERLKRCTAKCLPGYEMDAAVCVPKTTPDPLEVCDDPAAAVTEFCVRVECDNQNLSYDPESNACFEECQDGYVIIDGLCAVNPDKAEEVVDEDLSGSCAVSGLQYDSEKNQCRAECVSGMAILDGVCVDAALVPDETVSERSCETLGREWLASEDEGLAATCSVEPDTGCVDPDAVMVVGDADQTTYCEGGEFGVDLATSEDACNAANQVYIDDINACSGYCLSGFMYDDGTCADAWENEYVEGGNGDGYSEEGGCQYGADPVDGGYCAENEIVEQTDYDIEGQKYGIDRNIDKDTCSLLGRLWESGTDDETGETVFGCAVGSCMNEGDFIVEQSDSKPFCQGYITKLDASACDDLKRVWVEEVDGCAALPGGKGGDTEVLAAACQSEFSTYVHPKDEGEEAYCQKPGVTGGFVGTMNRIGGVFKAFARLHFAAVCAIQPGKHWNGEQCLLDQVASQDSGVGISPDLEVPEDSTAEEAEPVSSLSRIRYA